MRKRLASIAPLRAGIVAGVLYLALGLIVAFILGIAMFFSVAVAGKMQLPGAVGGAFAALCIIIGLPLFYGVIGFVGGVVVAAIYNLVAHFTGGLEFEFKDVAPAL